PSCLAQRFEIARLKQPVAKQQLLGRQSGFALLLAGVCQSSKATAVDAPSRVLAPGLSLFCVRPRRSIDQSVEDSTPASRGGTAKGRGMLAREPCQFRCVLDDRRPVEIEIAKRLPMCLPTPVTPHLLFNGRVDTWIG